MADSVALSANGRGRAAEPLEHERIAPSARSRPSEQRQSGREWDWWSGRSRSIVGEVVA